ncbi:MAG: DUF364 domain-containing protein [Treponema sp.]|jgi:uncharacterized protein (DUF4213/DUF364 family)|nr:DUF364 domain-containing protein [Treponema sp.]
MNQAKEASLWTLYDELIQGIPADYPVDEAIQGKHWTMVRSGKRVGLAMTLAIETRPACLPDSCRGMALKELAMAAKSWNFLEASLGVAAINAYWSDPEHAPVALSMQGNGDDAFTVYRNQVAGKKVAVIGHFYRLEQILGGICQLSILEKRPVSGDYPDSACEFLLPLQDYVFATGVTLTNKTLPRLLELSRHTGLILAGPSVPLAPSLFRWGVRDLQGFVVTDPDLCRAIVNGENQSAFIFDTGKRVGLTPEMVSHP